MHKVKLTDAVDEYLRYSQARGLKPNSIAVTKQALNPMIVTIGDIYVSSVTSRHIEEHFTKNGTWSANTRNLRLGQIRQFFKWCDTRNYKDPRNDVTWGWRSLKVPERAHLRIPVQDWAALLDVCDHPVDRATLATGLFLFLRASEMATLTVGSVQFQTHSVRVYRAKVDMEEDLPMSEELETELRRYLTWYTSHLADRGVAIDPAHTLLPPRRTSSFKFLSGADPDPDLAYDKKHTDIGLRVRNLLEDAGYTKSDDKEGFGCHVLRRSGARALFDELVESGYDGALKTVQAMLGHKNSVMTETYLGLTLDREKRNQLLAGKPMFPSLRAANVVPMRREEAR